MAECVVDASPLIFLANSEQLVLLEVLSLPVLVPMGVAEEIRAGEVADPARTVLSDRALVCVVDTPIIAPELSAWNLGLGETEVIATALARGSCEVVIDDLMGRRCARFFGLPVKGTLGLALLAKRRGIIDAARPVVEALVAGGMYLKEATIDEALSHVGE